MKSLSTHERPEEPRRDESLARRMAAGDRSALLTVYGENRDRVYSALYRLVGDAAEDLTHDAFIQAFERAEQFRGDGPIGAWVRRIALNLGLRYLRRRRLSRTYSRQDRPPPLRPTPLTAIQLERTILRLPTRLRVVLVLHAVEGYSHSEIAEMLGISEAAAKTRLHRARARLAADLDPGDAKDEGDE